MSSMGIKSQRKLFLFGKYSLAILPPKKWLTEFDVKRGDILKLELDRRRGRIVISLKDKGEAQKPKEPKSSSNDFEPIPVIKS